MGLSSALAVPRGLPHIGLAVSLIFASASCRGEVEPKLAGAERPLATTDPRALLPAAGLRWLLVGEPKRLLADEAFCGAAASLIPRERLTAFAQYTGIQLERAELALLAGYDLGRVYGVTFREPIEDRVVAAFREHLPEGGRIARAHTELQRLSGVAGDVPEALVTVGDHTALVALGDVTLAPVIEAFALGRLQRSPSALRGSALSRLQAPPPQAPAALYVPGPFVDEWAHAAGGVFGVVEAVVAAALPLPDCGVKLRIDFAGALGEGAAERLVQTFAAVADSSTGRVLGLDEPLVPISWREIPGGARLEIGLRSGPLAAGLQALISGEAWQILNLPAPPPPVR